MTSRLNNVTTGTVPVFTPMIPPTINSISHEALVKWKRERRDYESKLQARCRISGEDYATIVESITNAFEPDLLDVFCDLKLLQASTDVTEGMLIAEIVNIVVSVKNNTLPDIKELFKKEVKMNMGESDVDARVLDYFKTFNRVTLDHGLTDCFSSTDGVREKCKCLMASLHPKALKKEVKQCVRFSHKDAAKDRRLLFALIVEKSTEHERQYQRLKQKLSSLREKPVGRDHTSKNQSSPSRGKKKRRHGGAPSTPPSVPMILHANRGPSQLRFQHSRGDQKLWASGGPPGPYPKCKEMHWLRECTKSTQKQKDELFKRLREAKNVKRTRTKRLGEMIPKTERMVTLNGVLEGPYSPDSGSDYTVIGHSYWEKLCKADPGVQAVKLDTPTRNQAFGATWVTADSKASLHVLIHTAAGPVKPMCSVDVLVVDVNGDEFIVGNDLLVMLGINVDSNFSN